MSRARSRLARLEERRSALAQIRAERAESNEEYAAALDRMRETPEGREAVEDLEGLRREGVPSQDRTHREAISRFRDSLFGAYEEINKQRDEGGR
jgi:hypothetical protein